MLHTFCCRQGWSIGFLSLEPIGSLALLSTVLQQNNQVRLYANVVFALPNLWLLRADEICFASHIPVLHCVNCVLEPGKSILRGSFSYSWIHMISKHSWDMFCQLMRLAIAKSKQLATSVLKSNRRLLTEFEN